MTVSHRRLAVFLLVILALVAAWRWPRDRPAPPAADAAGAAQAPPSEASGWQHLLQEVFPGLDLLRVGRDSRKCEADIKAVTRQRWEALGRSDRRDHRIAHALLADAYGGMPGKSAQLLSDLLVADPGNAELLWFHATACHPEHGCDAREAAQRLVDAEPRNLAHWLRLIETATRHEPGKDKWIAGPENKDELAGLLHQAAKAGTHYASHWGDAFTLAYMGMEDLPVPTSCNSAALQAAGKAMTKMGVHGLDAPMDSTRIAINASTAAMIHAPTHNVLGELCKPEDATTTARIQACRDVASALSEGDTLLARGVGLSLMRKLGDGMPAREADAMRERYRQHRWMLDKSVELAMDFDSARILTMMTEGEVSAIQAELARRGKWPPPADWRPNDGTKGP